MSKGTSVVFEALPNDQNVDVLFIAGEHSGDEHGAALLRKLHTERPDLNVAAIGGDNLKRAGAHILFNPLESAVVGLVEVFRHFDYFKAVFNQTVDWIEQNSPKLVCFIDYPGLNLRLAKRLFQKGISSKGGGNVRLLFYISPQIWAWKAKRRFAMAKHLDAVGVIFPFEVDCYSDTELPTTFVGHPFVESNYTLPVEHDPDGALLLLPGSRKTPIQRIFPTMVDTYNLLKKDDPSLRAKVMYPTEKIRVQLEEIIESKGEQTDFELIPNSDTFTAKAVLTSSGTISLVCALAAIPGLLVYRTNPLSYQLALILVKIRKLGIANIILGQSIHPEYLQADMKSALLAEDLKRQLSDPETVEKTKGLSKQLRQSLSTSEQKSSSEWLLGELDKVG